MSKTLTATLNEVNSQLTEVQRVVVATLTAVQSGRLDETAPNVNHLRAVYEEGWNQLQGFLSTVRAGTMALTQAQPPGAASTPPSGPRLVSREPAAAVILEQQPQPNLRLLTPSPSRQAIHDLAAELSARAPAASRPVTPVQQPTGTGPTLKSVSNGAATLTQGDKDVIANLQSLVSPVGHNPDSADTIARRHDEEVNAGLIRLAIGNGGVLETWFAPEVFPSGKGVKKAVPDVNLYEEDIGTLPYSRLKGWPEGFYMNARTSAYQYLAHTNDITVVLDFGLITSDNVPDRQNGMQVISRHDNTERKIPVSHLENNFLKAVLLDLSEHFKQLWATKQQ